MDDEWYDEEETEQERLRRQRRAERMAEMRRSKRRQKLLRKILIRAVPLLLAAIALIVLLVFGIRKLLSKSPEDAAAQTETTEMVLAGDGALGDTTQSTELTQPEVPLSENYEEEEAEQEETFSYVAQTTEDTRQFDEDVVSTQAILVDRGTNTILAQRDARTRINPASMTKVLTVLVAAEHVTDLDDTFTVTIDITDYSYENDCSAVGFAENETVTVRDLFYGTILPSGADAAIGLATYVAGSQEAFVELMNEKLAELGLSDTAHFTNCVGIYDENHYCTAYDMAMILEAAVDNDLCREVLSAHTYTTSSTAQHPDGIEISNWFLRRIEDKDSGGTVVCGKTGYVVQSGNCAASYAEDADGEGYICVTVNATSGWRCIYDHVAIYKQFLPATAG